MISKKTITIFMLIASISFSSYAFNGITTNTKDKTKVIFVFSNKSKKMTGIILYESVNEKNMESFIQKYKDNSFFLGYIEGDFEKRDGEIKPRSGSTITIVKDRNSPLYDKADPDLWFSPKMKTSEFFSEKNFPSDGSIISFNYKSIETFPVRWDSYLLKNDKSFLIINII